MVLYTSSASPETSPPVKWHAKPFSRLAIGGLVLLAEYLAVSYFFDAQSVAARGGLWSVLALAGNIGPLLVVAAAAYLMTPGKGDLFQSTTSVPMRMSAWMLLGHALAAVIFAQVTARAFGKAAAPPGPTLLWLMVWTGLGVTTAASLLMGVLGNWRPLARAAARAFLAAGVFGLAAWTCGSATTELWAPLSRATFASVSAVMASLGFALRIDTTRSVLELEGFGISIAPVCSGMEGMGLYIVLMGGFLYLQRSTLRLPQAYLVLPVGLCVVWLGNVARIVALMLVGARIDPAIAIGSFHSKAGWVFFSAITLGVAALTRRLSLFSRRSPSSLEAHSDNPAVPLLLPILVWTGVGLLTSLFSEHPDFLYGARVIAAGLVIWICRRQYLQWCQRPAAAAWVLGLLVGVAWLAIPLGLPPRNVETDSLSDYARHLSQALWLAQRCIGAVIVVPLCEEFAFRAYLMRRLTTREFWTVSLTSVSWPALLGSSLIFGILHGRWELGILTGIAYAMLVRRTGRLIDGIIAHAVSNAVIAVWVVSTGDYRHW